MESTVRILRKSKEHQISVEPTKPVRKNLHEIDKRKSTKEDIGGNMRDLYNRKQQLEYCMKRVKTELDGSDEIDVLNFIEHMHDNERATLWITRCITALLLIRKQLKKPFKEATKEDIRSILKWMEDKKYKASTNEKFRQILKLFYKAVYGNGEYYPESVKWFSTRLGKEKRGKETAMDMSEYLEEAQIQRMIEFAPTLQKKAFVACLYESGARPEEFLRLTNADIRIETTGIVLMLRGKTGERRVRIIAFATLLLQWLDIHPLKNQKNYSLWVSESTNFKNTPLGIRGAEKIIQCILPKTGIEDIIIGVKFSTVNYGPL